MFTKILASLSNIPLYFRPPFSRPEAVDYNDYDFDDSVEDVPRKRENHSWTQEQLLAEREQISVDFARTIINLFQNDNSIPFLCRYRRDLIRNRTPAQMINLKLSYENISMLESRADKYVKQIAKDNKINNVS